jgi:hypothetical protein
MKIAELGALARSLNVVVTTNAEVRLMSVQSGYPEGMYDYARRTIYLSDLDIGGYAFAHELGHALGHSLFNHNDFVLYAHTIQADRYNDIVRSTQLNEEIMASVVAFRLLGDDALLVDRRGCKDGLATYKEKFVGPLTHADGQKIRNGVIERVKLARFLLGTNDKTQPKEKTNDIRRIL